MSEAPGFLSRILARLEAADVPYMLTGSFASSYHGVPRSTQDLDIVIDPSPLALRQLVDSLPKQEYYVDPDFAMEALNHRGLFNVIDLETGWKADLIIIKSRPYSRVEFDRRRRGIVAGISSFVTSPEDAILSKLEWATKSESERQLRDVAGVLAVQLGLDREYLEHWIEELGLQDAWRKARRLEGE